MIVAEFKSNSDKKVRNMLATRGVAISDSIEREMNAITIDLQTIVKVDKLSGQVLHRRSGNLSRSINQNVTREGNKAVTGIVGVGPTATKYGRIHEMGGTIQVPEVVGKLMVFQSGGQTVFTMRHKAFKVNMPERSYLRSTLSENAASIVKRLESATGRGVNS